MSLQMRRKTHSPSKLSRYHSYSNRIALQELFLSDEGDCSLRTLQSFQGRLQSNGGQKCLKGRLGFFHCCGRILKQAQTHMGLLEIH